MAVARQTSTAFTQRYAACPSVQTIWAASRPCSRTAGRRSDDRSTATATCMRAGCPHSTQRTAQTSEQHAPDVVELHLCVAVRRVVLAKHGHRPRDLDAGRVHRHEDHALLPVLWGRGVGLAHEDGDLAAAVAGAGDPPLPALDDVVCSCSRPLDRPCTPQGHVGGRPPAAQGTCRQLCCGALWYKCRQKQGWGMLGGWA